MSEKTKQLRQLLQQDQEPFHLQSDIADRRHQLLLRRRQNRSNLRLSKRKPNSVFASKLCKNGCFFSGNDSPDLTKSPVVDFSKSPENRKIILLQVPAKTAIMLLEASSRIQRQSTSKPSNSETKGRRLLTLFGSILKKLKHKDEKSHKRDDVRLSVRDILRWDSAATALFENSTTLRENPTFAPEIPESGCSCRHEDTKIDDFETDFCDSPFKFVLHHSPTGDRTPEFLTPVGSLSRLEKEGEENGDADPAVDDLVKARKNEEVKEHCSPESVLDHDPSAEEVEEDVEEGQEDDDESSSFDTECSYASIKRAQQKLLAKLSRFEKLAQLDHVELEKILLEDEKDLSDDSDVTDEELEDSNSKVTASSSKWAFSYTDKLTIEVLNQPEFRSPNGVTADLKKVTKRLLTEERKLDVLDDKDILLKRVSQRSNSWKEVVGDMIKVMVGVDVQQDVVGWTRKHEQMAKTAFDIELEIFEALVDEIYDELAS